MYRFCVVIAVGLLMAAGVGAADTDDDNVLVVGMPSIDFRLHPHRSYTVNEAQLYTALYEGLVTYNPLTLTPEPGVARRWEISDGGLEYRFYLRDDARYWNGDRVTAGHFVDAWLALLRDESAYYSVLFDVIAGAAEYRNGYLGAGTSEAAGDDEDDGIDGESDDYEKTDGVGISAPSDDELVIRLVAPAPQLLTLLCHYSFSPVHPRMLRLRGAWRDFPSVLSNGPYMQRGYDTEGVTLVPNPHYWDPESIGFTGIDIEFEDDPEELTEKFIRREVDWVPTGIGGDLENLANAIQVNPLFGTSFYFFRAAGPVWGDSRVRRALALLVPWDEIRSRDNYIYPTAALVPPYGAYPSSSGIGAPDRELSLELLGEAGYPEGRGLPALTIFIPENTEDMRLAGLMQEAWESELGLAVEITTVTGRSYQEALETEEYTIGRISWIGDYLDPLAFLELWKSDSKLNQARYNSAEYDDLLYRAARAERGERLDLLNSAEELILDEAVLLPVSHSLALNIIDTERIHGWFRNVLDIHPFKHMAFARGLLIPNVVISDPVYGQ